jgi:L-threonylcarbamoyladenylate synthase
MKTAIGTDIEQARKLLAAGELVAIPTETVYGLAANAFDERAVAKIFSVKNRPLFNPLIVHVSGIDQVRAIVNHIPPAAEKLMAKFSPGPLTILLPRNEKIPDIVTAGLPEVAIRIPSHPLTLELLHTLDFPLAAPSANPFGYISPTSAPHVQKVLAGKIPYILDGGKSNAGIESTIVGFSNGAPVIYRQGIITKEELEEIVGPVILNQSKKTVAPGMLESHYAPHTPLILTEDIDSAIGNFAKNEIGLITYNEYSDRLPVEQQILLYTSNDLNMAARNLYASLHEMDERGYKTIIVKKLPEKGIGIAINDRLSRAAHR